MRMLRVGVQSELVISLSLPVALFPPCGAPWSLLRALPSGHPRLLNECLLGAQHCAKHGGRGGTQESWPWRYESPVLAGSEQLYSMSTGRMELFSSRF